MRRQTHEAGYSWRKWTEPIVHDGRPDRRRRVILFLVVCIEAGAVAGLLAVR